MQSRVAVFREKLLTIPGKNEFYKVLDRTPEFILFVDHKQRHGIGILAGVNIGERGRYPIDGEGLNLSPRSCYRSAAGCTE